MATSSAAVATTLAPEPASSGAEAGAPSRPPPAPEPAKESEVRDLLDKARRQIDAGDHEGAARTFEDVLRIDPNNPRATDALERWRKGPRPPGPPR